MKYKFYILLPVILIFEWAEAFSQREDYNWMLGACSLLSDSTWSRIHWIFDEKGTFKEERAYKVDHKLEYTNASISDSIGQLLFYTNGLSVFNRNYEIIRNGDGLNPGVFATNSKDSGYKLIGGAIILPWPEHPHKYFIFHLTTTTDKSYFLWFSLGLLTTLVDMELEQGKGQVLYKNRSAYADSLVDGSLSACRHANGRDWWIPCFYYSGKKCLMFLLDPSGISLHHTQEIPFNFEPSGVGQAQFSPDGSKYSFFHRNGQNYREFFLSEFDRCTGILYNTYYHTMNRYDLVGVAFSPNSRFLYLATAYELFQLDMLESKPFESRIEIDSIDGFESFPLFPSYFSFMQLAPDNKIYINNGRSPDYLSTIEKPDLKGKACDVRQHNIHITSNATLPNFPYFRLGALESSTCDTLAHGRLPIAVWTSEQDSFNHLQFDFTDHSLYEVRNWNWDFGDSFSPDNKSTAQHPVHVFSQYGLYDVCLNVKNKIGSDTLCRMINIEMVSTEDQDSNSNKSSIIKLSPNPCNEFLNINVINYDPKNMLFQLYNNIGEKVKSKRLNKGNNLINTEDLYSGIYFISITEKGSSIKTEKLIKI